MNEKPIFNTVIVLTITMFIVKALSAIYRVPYQNILGDTGLYAYQQVYPIVAVITVLSLNAIPSVISQSNQQLQRQIFHFINVTRLIVFVILFISSPLIAQLMGDNELSPLLRIASLSLLPLSYIAIARGMLQRQHDMTTIAISQLIEQLLRVMIIILAIYLFTKGLSIYESGALSIFGSVVGASGTWLFLRFYKHIDVTPLRSKMTRKELKHFIVLITFYALSYLIMILWQVVDSFTVINGLLNRGESLEEAKILKGIYDRGGSLIQMGLIVTTSFSLVLVPLLAEKFKKKEWALMNDYATSALKITIVFSSAAAIGLFNLIRPFNILLFETADESLTLGIYMLAIIFVSLIMVYTAMLQIHSEYKIQAVGVILGLLVKTLLTLILIHTMGIKGVAIASVLGLITYSIIIGIKAHQLYAIKFTTFFIKWMITLIFMTIFLQLVTFIRYDTRIEALVVSLIGVVIGVIIVVVMMIKFKILTAKEWSYLPFGNYITRWMKE